MLPTGRLEDKAAIVRKCALQLLSKLLCFNPFGQFLPLDQLIASLNQYKGKLQVRSPALAITSDTSSKHSDTFFNIPALLGTPSHATCPLSSFGGVGWGCWGMERQQPPSYL